MLAAPDADQSLSWQPVGRFITQTASGYQAGCHFRRKVAVWHPLNSWHSTPIGPMAFDAHSRPHQDRTPGAPQWRFATRVTPHCRTELRVADLVGHRYHNSPPSKCCFPRRTVGWRGRSRASSVDLQGGWWRATPRGVLRRLWGAASVPPMVDARSYGPCYRRHPARTI